MGLNIEKIQNFGQIEIKSTLEGLSIKKKTPINLF